MNLSTLTMHARRSSLLLFLMVPLFGFFQYTIRNIDSEEVAHITFPPEYLGASLDHRIMQRFMGLRIVAADLAWIDLIVKSDMIRGGQAFSPFYRAARTIVTLDPDHYYAYYIAGMYLSVVKDDIKGATALLRDGAQYIQKNISKIGENLSQQTSAWKVMFMLGYNLIFEEFEVEEGSYWITEAAKIPKAPLYVTSLAGRVSTEAGRFEVGEKVLADFHSKVTNDEDRKRIEQKMLDLTAKRELAELNERFQNFLRTTQAHAIEKERAFRLFLRSNNHSTRNMLGDTLKLNALGKIIAD